MSYCAQAADVSTDMRNLIILLVVGLVPCALTGGFGSYGDTHALPWALGFGAQAALVCGVLALRKMRRSST